MQAWTKSIGIVNAEIVLSCRKAIVLNGYHGFTTQRSSAEVIFRREWMQRRQMFRLRCHNFELIKPANWG